MEYSQLFGKLPESPLLSNQVQKDVNDYSPVSIISLFSRILERIVEDQLYDFLRRNKVTTRNQSAFQRLCSIATSLIHITDSWYEKTDHKNLNLMISQDLGKAFDTLITES